MRALCDFWVREILLNKAKYDDISCYDSIGEVGLNECTTSANQSIQVEPLCGQAALEIILPHNLRPKVFLGD